MQKPPAGFHRLGVLRASNACQRRAKAWRWRQPSHPINKASTASAHCDSVGTVKGALTNTAGAAAQA